MILWRVIRCACLPAGLVLGGQAHAADLASSAPSLVSPISSIEDWSGIYLGVNGGFGRGTMVRDTVFGGFDAVNGAFAGVQMGYNVQLGAALVGVEGDIQAAHMTQTVSGAVQTIQGFATLRARAGYVLGDWVMPYVTGGVAVAKGHHQMPAGWAGTTSPDASKIHAGWTLGGGVEAKLTEAISVKTEYLHLNLGREIYFPVMGVSGTDVGISANVVRTGFNFRF